MGSSFHGWTLQLLCFKQQYSRKAITIHNIATPLAYYVNVTDMPHWHHEINNYCWYVLNMHVSKTAPLLQLHVLLCLWFVCMVQSNSILHVAAAVSTPVYIAHMLATSMPPCTNFQCILAIVM